jgi:hypothetical protein
MSRVRIAIGVAILVAVVSPAFGQSCATATQSFCDGRSPGGCWCDDACLTYNDCCADYRQSCDGPIVASFTPLKRDTSGGTLTISGDRFTFGSAAVPTVSVGDLACTITASSQTQISCTLPPGVGKDLPVVVAKHWTPTYGHAPLTAQAANTFAFNEPAIANLSSLHQSTAGGDTLTIVGANFGPATATATVDIAGSDCPVAAHTHTTITCVTPRGQGSDKPVIVRVGGQASLPASFNYEAPIVDHIVGPSIDTHGGPLFIIGKNFGATPTVTVNNIACPVATDVPPTDTQIKCIAPDGPANALATINVTVAGQTSNAFSAVYGPPVLDSITPATGATVGGDVVHIHGSGFGASGAVIIFGGFQATPDLQTNTDLTFKVPAGQGSKVPVKVRTPTQDTNSIDFSYTRPAITGIPSTPSTIGGTIQIDGNNFGIDPTVTVNTLPCTVVNRSHTQITCIAPPGFGLANNVVVQAGDQQSLPFLLTYLAPHIDTASPLSSATNPAGTLMVLTGTNFGPEGSATVTIGGRPCAVQSQTHTQIKCTIPSGEGAGLSIGVSDGTRLSLATSTFSYEKPVIASVSPAKFGTAGGSMQITGTNFGLSPSVAIDGNVCAVSTATHTSITCTVAPGEGSGHLITITAGNQSARDEAHPIAYEVPAISTVSSPSTQNGTIDIAGSNLGITPVVIIDDSLPCTVVTHDAAHITCNAPAGQGRGHKLRVIAGNQTSLDATFDYRKPTLFGVNPTSGLTSGGYELVLPGSDFGTAGATVTIGGKPCGVTSQTHTLIKCTAPAGEGRHNDVVVTAASQLSTPVFFDYQPPVISRTDTVPTAGGAMTIDGVNFGLHPSVTFDNVPCAIIGTATHISITCNAPADNGAIGPHQVVVTVASQTGSISAFYASPSIISVTSDSAPAAGGVPVTLTGTNFGTNATVTIGGKSCAKIMQTDATFVCTLPSGQGRDLTVTMTVSGRSSNDAHFSYDAPAVTSASSVPTSGGVSVIEGSNFGSAPSVTIDGTPCSVVAASDVHIECTVPAGVGAIHALVVVAGNQPSQPFNFAYEKPVLTDMVPANVLVPTPGNFPLTIRGTSLGLTGGTVSVGAASATIVHQAHDHIDIIVPAGQGSGVDVIVTVAGQPSNVLKLNYAPPVVAAVTDVPTSGGEITINGSNFSPSATVIADDIACVMTLQQYNVLKCQAPAGVGQRALRVNVGGQIATAVMHYLPPVLSHVSGKSTTAGGGTLTLQGSNFGATGATVTVAGSVCTPLTQDHVSITCRAPEGEGVNNPVIVATSDGRATSALFFSYDSPIVSSIDPSAIPTLGGLVTVHGTSFGLHPHVLFDGVNRNVTASTHQSVTFEAPEGTGVAHQIVVISVSQQGSILASYAAPQIGSLDAPDATTAGGTPLTLNGSNFGKARAVVTVGGAPCPILTQADARIVCTLPAGEGSHSAVALSVDQQQANPLTFHYPRPAIDAVTPAKIPTTGGVITLTGSNFGLTTQVTVNGGVCTLVSHTHTTAVCNAPAGVGLGVAVTVLAGDQHSDPSLISYERPHILNIDPPTARYTGGVDVTITGDNFGVAGASVTIGGNPCAVKSQSQTAITCTIPASTGAQDVIVTAGAQPSDPFSFHYVGPDPRIVVDPASIAFDGVMVGNWDIRHVFMRNDGVDPLTILSAQVTGSNPTDFNFDLQVPFVIAPGSVRDEIVVFVPRAAGARSASLAIVSDDSKSPSISVALTGTGTMGAISVSPSTLDFGTVLTGSSKQIAVTITNTGDAQLVLQAIAIGGTGAEKFSSDLVSPYPILQPGASQTFFMTYAPQAVGTDAATLTMRAFPEITATVALSGSGATAELSVSPGQIAFDGQLVGRPAIPRPVTLRNTGTTALSIHYATAGDAAFTVTGGALNLAPAQEATIPVQFTAATIGNATGSLHITAEGLRTINADVALSGVGLSTLLSAVPLSVDFGLLSAPATSLPQSVIITNLGGDPITLLDGVMSGSTGFTATSPAGSLAPKATREVRVTFASAAPGAYTSKLKISATDASIPAISIDLAAQVAKRTIKVKPTNVKFGKTNVGETATDTVTVTNDSPVAVAIAQAVSLDATFEVRNVNTTPIAPGGSTTFDVVFHPLAATNYDGEIQITLAGSATADAVVPVSGVGTVKKK